MEWLNFVLNIIAAMCVFANALIIFRVKKRNKLSWREAFNLDDEFQTPGELKIGRWSIVVVLLLILYSLIRDSGLL